MDTERQGTARGRAEKTWIRSRWSDLERKGSQPCGIVTFGDVDVGVIEAGYEGLRQ
jgi:hypothetical protein